MKLNLNRYVCARRAVFLILLLLSGTGAVWADRRHHTHFGVILAPTWGPRYFPPPYYYPPYAVYPPLVVERAPSVYIEQPQAALPPATQLPQTQYWYFCKAMQAYYPYVKECPGGWQKILPTPPGLK